ncbi:MAG: hypothetical protein WCT23_03230 [Candidatus Neomarinimicrobiota bacterium]
MKKRVVTIILLFSMLCAYDLGMGGLGQYTIFDPHLREPLLSYPTSWLKPSQELFDHNYQDSSSTYAKWERFFALGFKSSNNIIAKYTPFSSPHRWSVGLQFTNYSMGNPSQRNDAVLHYKNDRGEIHYYHTNNTQIINMLSRRDVKHKINTNALNFKYSLNDKFKLSGGVDLSLIEQSDDSTRNYNINHDHIKIQYLANQNITAYSTFHYWYWVNEDKQGPEIFFYPGIKFTKGILLTHLSLKISSSSIMPIVEIKIQPGVFHLHSYLKTQSPRIALAQTGNQYTGLMTGINIASERHEFMASIQGDYDFLPATPSDTVANYNFYSTQALAEYRLKLKNVEAYSSGQYYYSFNPIAGFYNPEIATIALGLKFFTPLANKKLILNGDINAQYIIHEDPDNVSFDPSALTYTRLSESTPVGDWLINLNLNARVQTFLLTANISLPLNPNNTSFDYFKYGFKTSSDISYGHGAYTGLTIEWLWWK